MMIIPPLSAFAPLSSSSGAAATSAAGDGGFASVVNALQPVQQAQNAASVAEASASAGTGSVSDALIASTKASLDTQITVALTTKAVAAFNDVMNLQF
jgi:flagellar hook-basal body complex protein FliE